MLLKLANARAAAVATRTLPCYFQPRVLLVSARRIQTLEIAHLFVPSAFLKWVKVSHPGERQTCFMIRLACERRRLGGHSEAPMMFEGCYLGLLPASS
jgi:hypothetical protein